MGLKRRTKRHHNNTPICFAHLSGCSTNHLGLGLGLGLWVRARVRVRVRDRVRVRARARVRVGATVTVTVTVRVKVEGGRQLGGRDDPRSRRGCVGAGVGREGGARGARLWRAGRSAAGGGDAAASDLQIKGGGARQGTVKKGRRQVKLRGYTSGRGAGEASGGGRTDRPRADS